MALGVKKKPCVALLCHLGSDIILRDRVRSKSMQQFPDAAYAAADRCKEISKVLLTIAQKDSSPSNDKQACRRNFYWPSLNCKEDACQLFLKKIYTSLFLVVAYESIHKTVCQDIENLRNRCTRTQNQCLPLTISISPKWGAEEKGTGLSAFPARFKNM